MRVNCKKCGAKVECGCQLLNGLCAGCRGILKKIKILC